ncbi:hypothetical protein EGT74_25860 [Chitinophaga lutea]|uniref:Signal transduction histidine kinase internal region domain-containing protein n=2 Tax=Chitinophaga lutea TaxID=2488634 RepID=A0A3N4PAY0_9BACT|nr:hypothetical protein EGT74_25860 [Chitinophaga lutea]
MLHMQEEKTLKWWPLQVFVWTLLTLSLFMQVMIQSPMGFYRSVLYTSLIIGTAIPFTLLLSDVLLPVFIRRRQLARFVGIGLLACSVMGLLFALIDRYFDPEEMSLIARWFSMLTSALLITGSICGIRFYREHATIDKKHRTLQNAHLEAELQLLRDQVNPHFLFNVMNSIHVLMKKDVQQASSVLLKFSDMLRHQLYDSGKAYIPLNDEIGYLKNYVNVEMTRWGSDVTAECRWPEAPGNRLIAPFLLSPFIENAFKFVSRDRYDGNFVKIDSALHGQLLTMEVTNTFDHQQQTPGLPTSGGIGLRNVQKRLSLLYPGRHNLKISQQEHLFSIKLSIQLGDI